MESTDSGLIPISDSLIDRLASICDEKRWHFALMPTLRTARSAGNRFVAEITPIGQPMIYGRGDSVAQAFQRGVDEAWKNDPRSVKVVMRHNGIEYAYRDPYPMTDATDDEVRDGASSMYQEGNYSCDCNRSIFIDRYCDNAPESWPDETEDGNAPCGETIELVSLTFVDSTGNETEIELWQDHSQEIRQRAAAIGIILMG